MSIPRNLGAFADNVTSTGTLNVTGINATGTPSSTTVLAGNGSWVTPSAGAWVYVSQVVASNSATVSFTGLTSYDTYVLVVSKALPSGSSSASNLLCVTSTDNGSTYASTSYNYITSGIDNAGTARSQYSSSGTEIRINPDNTDSNSKNGISAVLYINRINGTNYNYMIYGPVGVTNDGNRAINGTVAGTRVETSALNAVRFSFNGWNIATGTFRLYGISNS